MLLRTDTTPFTLRASDSARSFSAWLLAKPDSCTVPFNVYADRCGSHVLVFGKLGLDRRGDACIIHIRAYGLLVAGDRAACGTNDGGTDQGWQKQ